MSIKVSRDIIPFFDQAVIDIFDQMLSKKVSKIGNYLDKSIMEQFFISGMMGFSGDINGNTSVSFKKNHVQEVVSLLLSEDVEISDEATIEDGVGEMINMISGQAKRLMAGNIDINISIPTVVSGKGHQICVKAETPQIFMLYNCEETVFSLQLAFKIKS